MSAASTFTHKAMLPTLRKLLDSEKACVSTVKAVLLQYSVSSPLVWHMVELQAHAVRLSTGRLILEEEVNASGRLTCLCPLQVHNRIPEVQSL